MTAIIIMIVCPSGEWSSNLLYLRGLPIIYKININMSERDSSYKEVIDTLKQVKKYQPLKTDSWTAADLIKHLWLCHSEGLIKSTTNGYELTEKGDVLLNKDTF